jgi:hypothetical protein
MGKKIEIDLDISQEALDGVEFVEVKDKVFMSSVEAIKVLTKFVEKLINEGKLIIAEGHEDYFKNLNITKS